MLYIRPDEEETGFTSFQHWTLDRKWQQHSTLGPKNFITVCVCVLQSSVVVLDVSFILDMCAQIIDVLRDFKQTLPQFPESQPQKWAASENTSGFLFVFQVFVFVHL